METNESKKMTKEYKDRLATASAAGIIGIVCSIWLFIEAILFLTLGDIFTLKLAPLLADLTILAALLNIVFGVLELLGVLLIFNFKYRNGGTIIILTSVGSIISGGGFYISFLWGIGVGLIALICPKLEDKILKDESTG
ncbi:MAG: hypothetical protein ACTSRG_10890 [Candidatus Helarchaeota archaeon]